MTPWFFSESIEHPQDVVHDFDEDILKTQLQIFSKMGFIKTPIRSTMSHEPLNHCMIFSTHKEEVDKLNLKK